MTTTLRAGFGRSDITPRVGSLLTGYFNRAGGSTGVHDPLHCRALALEEGGGRWALLSVEICYLNADSVAELRAAIQARTAIPASHIFIATTHTHSGPHDRHADNWPRPLAALAADAVEQAVQSLQAARLGSGLGMLSGAGINRRWLDRPVDPALGVLRIDALDGRTLGLVTVFASHAVVLGSDNLLISADWPGYACARMEQELGAGTVCLFFQGGAANVNPLTTDVAASLAQDAPVTAIGGLSTYYAGGAGMVWNIGDRQGGTFAESDELGARVAREALHVARTLVTAAPASPLWSQQIVLSAGGGPAPLGHEREWLLWVSEEPERLLAAVVPAEVMLLGLGDALLMGQPGEVFSETSVALRSRLRSLGITTPLLVSYANGWLGYLPEAADYAEGGYEVSWPRRLGIREEFQDDVRAGIEKEVRQRLTG